MSPITDSDDNLPCAATASGVPAMVLAVYFSAFCLLGTVTSRFSVVTRLGLTASAVDNALGGVRSSSLCTC